MTQRVAASTAVADLSDAWRELFERNPAVVILVDPADSTIVAASDAAVAFYGYPRNVLAGMPIAQINMLPPAVIDQRIHEAEARSTGTRYFRFPHRLASGEVKAVDVFTRPVTFAGRTLLQSVIHDVTEHAGVESARDLLATAVGQSTEAVVITDLEGRILYVNPAFERVTGYSREEALGQNPRILKSGVHSAEFYRSLWETVRAGGSWTGELVNRRRDGTLYTEEASITPVYDDAGQLAHYVAVKRDVTAERADRAARDWYAAIVESAQDAAFAVSLDGRVLAWNDAAVRLYGWDREEILGRSQFDISDAVTHAAIGDWIRRVAGGESIGPELATHVAKDGRRLVLSVIASPVRDASGAITGVATIARDVSVEQQRAKEREALEAQLRQAQKMEAIGRLAGGVAHDFNNLLTAIRGYAAVVADEVDGAAGDDVGQIIHAADRAADLTQRLLAFARSRPADPRPVDLDAVLQDSYKLVNRLVPEPIAFELRTESGARVVADRIEIEQLLLNLVANAVDAIPGTGRISVTTALDPAGDTVRLTVSDTGRGIDEEARAHIFEPFFTTKGEGRGTGLGLATVYAIVQRAGGTIEVTSAMDEGTTFHISLPRDGAAAPARPPRVSAAPGGTEHILVVEDAPVLGALARRLLEGAGYRVTLAGCPDEVLGRDLGDIDAIVADVLMPGMSGPEMVDRLDLGIPVLFVSGYAGRHLPSGIDTDPRRAFLEKPYRREALLATLRRILDAAPA